MYHLTKEIKPNSRYVECLETGTVDKVQEMRHVYYACLVFMSLGFHH
jgi:hypothetical protein